MIFNSLCKICKINLSFVSINLLNYMLKSFLYVKSIVTQLTKKSYMFKSLFGYIDCIV